MSSDPQTFFAVYLATGEIVRSGSCRQSMVAAQAVNPGEASMAVGQMVADTTDWVNAGLVEQRPIIVNVPSTKALVVDEDWVIAGVPDGTEVYVDGSLVGTVDLTGLTLAFPVAADWAVDLIPPFPYRPSSCVVTVT